MPQQNAYVVERLGKYNRTLSAGFHILIPFIYVIRYRHSLKEDVIDIPEQECITRDNVQVGVDGVLYSKVIDPERASYGITNLPFAIIQLAQTTLRSEIGKLDLDRTFEERTTINHQVVTEIDKASEAWGVKVLRYEIKNIRPPKDIPEAMEKQMRAEREKRAAILKSEGERDALINTAEGAQAAGDQSLGSEEAAEHQRGRGRGRGDSLGRASDRRRHPPGRAGDPDAGRPRGRAAARRRAVRARVRQPREGRQHAGRARRTSADVASMITLAMNVVKTQGRRRRDDQRAALGHGHDIRRPHLQRPLHPPRISGDGARRRLRRGGAADRAEAVITTDAEGLVAGEVKIPARHGGRMPGYRADARKGRAARSCSSCRRSSASTSTSRTSAGASRSAATSRSRPSSSRDRATRARSSDPQEILAEVVAKMPDAQVMADLDATVAWAAERRRRRQARHHRLLLGRPHRLALRRAQRELKAGVAWYGRLDGTRTALHPQHPLDVAAELKAPVLGLYGGADEGIPQRRSSRPMRAGAEARARSPEIVVYPDAPHGFHADYRPSYREADAEDGWKRMLAWFKKNGVPGHA